MQALNINNIRVKFLTLTNFLWLCKNTSYQNFMTCSWIFSNIVQFYCYFWSSESHNLINIIMEIFSQLSTLTTNLTKWHHRIIQIPPKIDFSKTNHHQHLQPSPLNPSTSSPNKDIARHNSSPKTLAPRNKKNPHNISKTKEPNPTTATVSYTHSPAIGVRLCSCLTRSHAAAAAAELHL